MSIDNIEPKNIFVKLKNFLFSALTIDSIMVKTGATTEDEFINKVSQVASDRIAQSCTVFKK